MKSYVVAPEAEDDLRQIWRYLLGKAGLEVADRIQEEFLAAFEELVDLPAKGHRRPDLTARDVVFFNLYQYMIVYRRRTNIEIVAILHGKRDVRRLLKSRLLP